MASAALLEWHGAFGGLPPIGFMLREGAADRWVQLYSLPGGQRYATSEAESSALVQRQHVVASAVLGLGATVTAWVAHHGDGPPPLDMTSWACESQPPAWRAADDDLEWLAGARIFERTLTWAPGALDAELRSCAEDRLASLTVYSHALGSAFCPYDGGMDVILRAPGCVDAIRQLFPDWVSTHPAGL